SSPVTMIDIEFDMSSRHNPSRQEPGDPDNKTSHRFLPRRQRDWSNDDEIPVRRDPTRKSRNDDDRQPPAKR
ncbi:MAG TPA: hypothetical protein VFP92_11940, partial [Rhodanobacteraceae bacterium]|nr:hypothetical protein [Rhodanobacteraceae bacterium]